MKTKFRNWLIKLIVNKVDYWFIKKVYESANFKYQREQVELGDQLKVQAEKEMKEFLAYQSDAFKDELNKQAVNGSPLVNLVPIDYSRGFTNYPMGVFKKCDSLLKLEEYIPPTVDTIKAYEDYMTRKMGKTMKILNNNENKTATL